jgi:hypothetical protein
MSVHSLVKVTWGQGIPQPLPCIALCMLCVSHTIIKKQLTTEQLTLLLGPIIMDGNNWQWHTYSKKPFFAKFCDIICIHWLCLKERSHEAESHAAPSIPKYFNYFHYFHEWNCKVMNTIVGHLIAEFYYNVYIYTIYPSTCMRSYVCQCKPRVCD